ncbi:MAG TPA: amidohydrolase family protein, partial [Trebonia sp.]|nr:amidohydrolase family protein [Trebonia sp.]
MLDLIITGATVVTPDGVTVADVGISGSRIAALALPGSLGTDGAVIDGAGLIALPGGIDPHIHAIRPPGVQGQGREAISRAAVYGGMTTLIDFARPQPGDGPVLDQVRRARDQWEGSCYANFAFHVICNDQFGDDQIDEIPALIAAGFPSFKVFTTNMRPGQLMRTSGGTLHDIMRHCAGHGGIVDVHGEDDETVMHQYRKHLKAGRTDLVHMAEVHNVMSEDLSFHHVLRMASYVPGAPVYFHHVTARAGVAAIAGWRASGLPVYGETLLPLAFVTSDAYAEPDGVKYHLYPSLKSADDVAALWEGIENGTIHTFGTDGACPTYEEKMASRTIDGAFGGVTGVEPKLALLYTELVGRRGLGLPRLAQVTSENAARIFGLYPRKGAIAVGSDADIVLFDPADERVIAVQEMHEGDFSPWHGRRVSGWPSQVIVNGRLVVERGIMVKDEMTGEFLPRELSPQVAAGTA